MKYNPKVVTAFFKECKLPPHEYEYKFHPERKFRFDLAWPNYKVYLEVDGGIFIRGGHNRGAQILKDWDKRNNATMLGWRGLWVQPKDLCMTETVEIIRSALSAPHAAWPEQSNLP